MMKITRELMLSIAPAAKLEIAQGIIDNQGLFIDYGLNDDDILMSLGQMAAETQGFTRLEESLYYTTTKRLRQVWPSRFKSDTAAKSYVRNPQALANLVYGGRLGNTQPNDGWDFRGSGCKQTTGRYNFEQVEKATGVPVTVQPHLLRRFPEALESACVYWRDNKLSRFTATRDVTGLTKAIQGGNGALADRRVYTKRAFAYFESEGKIMKPAIGYLRNGSRGDAVKRLQQRLYDRGYDEVGRIDGVFGGGTEDALQHFQRDNGLIADGVYGPDSDEAMVKAELAGAKATTGPVPAEEKLLPPADAIIIDDGNTARKTPLVVKIISLVIFAVIAIGLWAIGVF